MTKCNAKRFLWWTWIQHDWTRIDVVGDAFFDGDVIGIEHNCVFWKKDQFDDGPYPLMQAVFCQNCNIIDFKFSGKWAFFPGVESKVFKYKEDAISYIRKKIYGINLDIKPPHGQGIPCH